VNVKQRNGKLMRIGVACQLSVQLVILTYRRIVLLRVGKFGKVELVQHTAAPKKDMKFAVFYMLAAVAMALPVTGQPAKESNGNMRLRGGLLDEETNVYIPGFPLEADTEPIEEGEDDTVTTEMAKEVEKEFCKQWDEKPDYPAGITCALMKAELDGESEAAAESSDAAANIAEEAQKALIVELREVTPSKRELNESHAMRVIVRLVENRRIRLVGNDYRVTAEFIKSHSTSSKRGKKPGTKSKGTKTAPKRKSAPKKEKKKASKPKSAPKKKRSSIGGTRSLWETIVSFFNDGN